MLHSIKCETDKDGVDRDRIIPWEKKPLPTEYKRSINSELNVPRLNGRNASHPFC